MKTALKWVGWGLLVLIGLGLWSQMDKISQTIVAVGGVIWYVAHGLWKEAERQRKSISYRIDRIEEKLDQLLHHPLNTRHVLDGIEGIVDEFRDRQRARERDASGRW